MTVVNNEVLLSCSGQTGALAATYYLQLKTPNRTHVPISVSITVGTATVKIWGRNTASDEWVELAEATATDAICLQWMPQMKATLSAATDATVRVSVERAGTEVAL